MARSIVLLAFALCSKLALCQAEGERVHELRIGLNASLYNDVPLLGLGNHAEYAYSFSNNFAIVPRIMSANGNERTAVDLNEFSSMAVALSLRATPFPNAIPGLKVDVGGLYHRLRTTASQYGTSDGIPFAVAQGIQRKKEDLFGVFGSASMVVLSGSRLQAGLHLSSLSSIQRSALSLEITQAGMFMGVRF